MALFDIVPNLSEGRNLAIIGRAVDAVSATGAHVLHRTSDAAHHRSVLTIVGNAQQVTSAAVAIAGVARDAIDLREHQGVHPRIGALDVLPFVPLEGATLDEAITLAHNVGELIWQRYAIPSFFYGAAARTQARRLLADVRAGQFEGLVARFKDPAWAPDVGTVARHESAGAIAIGARPILVAFNIELETSNLTIAKAIARQLRERDGGLRTLRALGLRLSASRVQVSLNVTDVEATPLHRIVELVRHLARARGVTVAGSELIGCIPRAAVEASARYYLGIPD
jgi:glutamate formiminotransferase